MKWKYAMPKPTTDELISNILRDPAPIIFLDTCVILDIIRVLYREKVDNRILKSAKDLIRRSKIEPKKLWLLTSEIVEIEWNNNIDSVVRDLRSEIVKLEKNFLSLKIILEDIFPETCIQYPDIKTYSLDTFLRNYSEKLLTSSISFLNDEECLAKSTLRVIKNEAPASKGKSEAKDCMIIEHYLKVSQRLQENGFNEKRIFITSNSNDYGNPSDTKEPLKCEFDKIGLEYVNNFSWAISMI